MSNPHGVPFTDELKLWKRGEKRKKKSNVWPLIWSQQGKGKIVVVIIGGCFSSIYKCHILMVFSFQINSCLGGGETEDGETYNGWSLIWSQQRKGKIVVVVIGGCYSIIYKCHVLMLFSFPDRLQGLWHWEGQGRRPLRGLGGKKG